MCISATIPRISGNIFALTICCGGLFAKINADVIEIGYPLGYLVTALVEYSVKQLPVPITDN